MGKYWFGLSRNEVVQQWLWEIFWCFALRHLGLVLRGVRMKSQTRMNGKRDHQDSSSGCHALEPILEQMMGKKSKWPGWHSGLGVEQRPGGYRFKSLIGHETSWVTLIVVRITEGKELKLGNCLWHLRWHGKDGISIPSMWGLYQNLSLDYQIL